MIFSSKRSPILHPHSLGYSSHTCVNGIKDLGSHLPSTLSFGHHVDVTVGRALKILEFVKRNSSLFSSASYLRALYFCLVRSIQEHGIT
ncbi:Hypothetical protein CINCED_3A010991, partial [Cinara cedri]